MQKIAYESICIKYVNDRTVTHALKIYALMKYEVKTKHRKSNTPELLMLPDMMIDLFASQV